MALAAPVGPPFADLSAFIADTTAINAATKTALLAGLDNIIALYNNESNAPHPDFGLMNIKDRDQLLGELNALRAAIVAHA